jgi:cold shock CspA family protein
MQVPLEIAFHGVAPSPWAEQEIRERVAHLERIYGRLVSCRVRVDKREKKHNDAIPPVVRIELGVPGKPDLVVTHEPEHLLRKFQAPDLRNAIHEAFRIAERRLADLKDERMYHVRHRREAGGEARPSRSGQVAQIHREDGYGFVMTAEGGLIYFNRAAMAEGDFDALKIGVEIDYEEEASDTGPIATDIRVRTKEKKG